MSARADAMSARVSVLDLARAADWLDAYDADDGETTESIRCVAARMREEIKRRQQDALAREISRKTGVGTARVKKMLAEKGML